MPTPEEVLFLLSSNFQKYSWSHDRLCLIREAELLARGDSLQWTRLIPLGFSKLLNILYVQIGFCSYDSEGIGNADGFLF